ncbi:MAG: hypothetical protein EOP82_15775 [Variovorax sp.]|nr:MAG: hypothetical protein EOP82_15775 [Variovorax sp.]
MNLYPSGDDPGGTLAPAEWTMTVAQEGTGDEAYFVAELRQSGKHVCRLCLMGTDICEDETRRALAIKARHWIDDYLTRPHTGSTEFGSLM